MRSLLKSSGRVKASLKPDSVICQNLWGFLQGFSHAQQPVPVQQPPALPMRCLGPAPALCSFLLHICLLAVRADMFCECRSSTLNSR